MAPSLTKGDKLHNPNEDLEIPSWITAEYMQPIVENDVSDFKQILNLRAIAANQPGENYMSIMVRVMLDIELNDGTVQETSYVVKTTLAQGTQGAAIAASMGLFPKESHMYEVVLPNLTKLYEEAGMDVKLMPRCLHIENIPERTTLVMEDLKRQNFSNADRLKGLDFAHMRRVLEKLAELHAASAVYYELNGPFHSQYEANMFTEENLAMFKEMSVAREASFERAMADWDLENCEYYIKKTPTMENSFEESKAMFTHDPTEFNVLNHGDCWVNNIMFNHKDNGDIDEVRLVDYQIGKWGSPTQDLWYFILTSASLDIKIKEFDHFIYIYHKRLAECLEQLKYVKPIPKLRELHIQMLKYGFWGFFTAVGVMSVVLLPSDKDSNVDNMLLPGPEGDKFRQRLFANSYFVRAMCQLYPFLDKKGLLAG